MSTDTETPRVYVAILTDAAMLRTMCATVCDVRRAV